MPRLGVTGGAILASTLILAVLAVLALVTLLVAQLTKPARTTDTGAIFWLTVGIVSAGAHLQAILAIGVGRAGPVAMGS